MGVCARVLSGHSCGHCFAVADFEVDKTCKTKTKFSRIILMIVDRSVTVPWSMADAFFFDLC